MKICFFHSLIVCLSFPLHVLAQDSATQPIRPKGNVEHDACYLTLKSHQRVKLSAPNTDFVRENLIHIFDSANFHQMIGGLLPVKSKREMQKQLEMLRSDSFIELNLDKPARIVVEGTEIHAKTMWASIRESDGWCDHWVLEQPNGDLVTVTKTRGELIVQFAPQLKSLIEMISLQVGADQPAIRSEPKSEGDQNPNPESDGISR